METINKEPFQRLNPLNDYYFFKVMGERGDEVQLLGFLNAVLSSSGKNRIQSLEIIEDTSFVKETLDSKSCILDVLAVLTNGTRVNIEVQLSNEHNIDRRSLFYWSKVYAGSLGAGQDYRELPNVIAINIVDFNFPLGAGFHTCFRLRETNDPSMILTDALEIHFLNMVQWRKQGQKDVKNDPLHRWLAWFDESSPVELVEEVVGMDGAIAEAYKKLEEAKRRDPGAYRHYWAERKFEHDRVSMINGARREGREQGLSEVARKMKARGRPLEEIMEDTGLSLEAIEEL